MQRLAVLIALVVAACGGPTGSGLTSHGPVPTSSPVSTSSPVPTSSAIPARSPVSTGGPSPAGSSPEASSTAKPHLGTTEGCKPSFWAKPGNFDLWEEHRPDDLVGIFFPEPADYAQLGLGDALQPTPDGDPRRTLIREAVAAILNAAHESLEYPYSRYQPGVDDRHPIVPTVAELLRTGTQSEMSDFERDLTAANDLGCPLR